MAGSKCSNLGARSDPVALWGPGSVVWALVLTIPSRAESRIATTTNLEIRIGDLLSWRTEYVVRGTEAANRFGLRRYSSISNYRGSAHLGLGVTGKDHEPLLGQLPINELP